MAIKKINAVVNGQEVKMDEQELIENMYSYIRNRFDEEGREIRLEANGKVEFIIVPFNPLRNIEKWS